MVFNTHVDAAQWDQVTARWHLRTDTDQQLSCRFLVMASGCLSLPKAPDIQGAERFKGEVYFTSRWPQQGVDFTGKRVAVIGNGPVAAERRALLDADRAAYRQAGRWSRAGVPIEPTQIYGRYSTPELRRERFEAAWQTGELILMLSVFADQMLFAAASGTVAGMVREKIRGQVHEPETAALLCPTDHAFGTKRPCLNCGYFASFNRPNVRLVDLKRRAIQTITETGITLADVDWVGNCLDRLRANGFTTIEPTAAAEAGWMTPVNDCGVDAYRQACDDVVTAGDLGFKRSGPNACGATTGWCTSCSPSSRWRWT